MSELRSEIDRRIAAADQAGARRLLAELWQRSPDLPTANYLLSRIDEVRTATEPVGLRVAVLRSFTVEPVIPLLRAAARLRDIDLEVRLGAFNAYAQEILDPTSWLTAFDPQVVVLAVQARDLVPTLVDRLADLTSEEVDAAVAEAGAALGSYLTVLRQRSPAYLIVHNFERSAHPPTGLLAAQIDDPIERLNAELRRVAAAVQGASVLDYDGLVARHGRLAWHDPVKWLTVRQPIRADRLGALAEEWLRFLVPLSGRVCKVLVCDLDNTLWGGVVGEDGLAGLRLDEGYPGEAYRSLQRAILDLARRGVVLAICSKNNSDDAMRAISEHPGMLLRPHDFAAQRINWGDKVQNLRDIATELNLGLDAVAFLDDNPAERDLVRSLLPEVVVIELPEDPFGFAEALRRCPVFERLSLSAEDGERARMYLEQRQRRELETQSTSLEDFYRSLDMQARIAALGPATVARAAQLTQKTNQFNLTTQRYSEQRLAALAADPRWCALTVALRDRFGDNGTVGLMIAERVGAAWEIDTFLMSCRVIGRTVETAMLAALAEIAGRDGARTLRGAFRPTKKNVPARDFYPDHGFVVVAAGETEIRYELDLGRGSVARPPWVRLQIETEVRV